MRVPLVYKDKPFFGLDIGYNSAKIVQLRPGQHPTVLAYGKVSFPSEVIIEGIVADPVTLAKHLSPLISSPTEGHLSARRASIALPLGKVFIRTLELPAMNKDDMEQAVKFEAEQYVPVPIADLYIDYKVIQTVTKNDQKHNEVLMVAAPRAIVDSYIKLCDYLNLEIELIESSISAITRGMIQSGQTQKSLMIMDFNSRSADLAIVDKALRLTGMVPLGGEDLTKALVEKLGVTYDQAKEIKFKFGVGPSGLQAKVVDALSPLLQIVTTEIKKVTKYYQERSENQDQVQSLVLTGGGASLPGLVEYLHKDLKLPIAIGNPWSNLSMGRLTPPTKLEAPIYASAIGLALAERPQ